MKVRVRVGKSRIAGQGLFTAQDIKKDTRIIRYIGKRISKAESAKCIAEGIVYITAIACNSSTMSPTPSILDQRRASALLHGSHLTSKPHATMWCSFFT